MDEHLLDSGSGDAIARDWELPELPSGTPSLPTSTSLPTSQELAEIFGTSDDEDDDFPFPLSTDLNISSETKQFANSSLFSSVIGQETSLFLGQLGDPLAMGEVGGATKRESMIENKEDVSKTTGSVAESVAKEGEEEMETSSDAADNLVETSPGSAPVPVQKSSRLSSQQKYQKTEDIKPTKPPKQVEEKSKISSMKIAEKQTSVQVETVETMSGKEEAATKEEEEVETEELEDSEDDESISDDPDRLWCICMKPHNDSARSLVDIITFSKTTLESAFSSALQLAVEGTLTQV